MAKKNDEFQYEDGPFYVPFDFINKDLDLLFILIFIEAFKEKRNILNFSEFLKGNYWDMDDIKEEVRDTNDYMSIEDMVMQHVPFIFEDLRLGKLVSVGIDDLDRAFEDIMICVAKIGPEKAKIDVQMYMGAVEQIIFLKDVRNQQFEIEVEKNPDKVAEIIKKKHENNSIFFTEKEGYFRKFQEIAVNIPEHIQFNFKYNGEKIKELEEIIPEFIVRFSNDEYINSVPQYKDKRIYFAQQIENFYRYISKLNQIGDFINIPFTILTETGFEAVKILSLLEQKGVIKIRWSDEGSWRVRFLVLPITPENLLNTRSEKPIIHDTEEFKLNLSFSHQTGIMTLSEMNGKEHRIKVQGQVQKEVLRTIFEFPKNTYSEWTLHDISDALGRDDADETAVKNAIYQFNRKVKLAISQVENLFELTKYSAQLNSKYVNKN